MKLKNLLVLFVASSLATTALVLNSCKKDEAKPAPTVTLTATTFSGKIGATATTAVTVTAPGGLKSLKITKYKGTAIDATFGTNGTETYSDLTHTLNYVLAEEGLTTPIRFKFAAEDDKGQIGTNDFIITTEPSVSYLLVKYDWQWKSKVGKVLASDPGESEQILDCEKDNFYSFNADGTFAVNFGAITGTGGGTCDFDGFRTPTTWSLNAGETELTIRAASIFDPTDIQTEVYKITSATSTSIKSTQTIDLTVFGGIVYDWKFEWTAKPK